MKAIVTKYKGPTERANGTVKGSRIIVNCDGLPRFTVEVDNRFSVEDNHTEATKAFAVKYLWNGYFVGSNLPNGTRVFTLASLLTDEKPRYTTFTVKV